MKLKNLLLALGLGTTLALAACGGSDDSSSSDSSSTKEESTMNDDSSKTETAVDAEKNLREQLCIVSREQP